MALIRVSDLPDFEQIKEEAKHRWLRPTEIFDILSNYQKLTLTPNPPDRPPAGSLFLFDRKELLHFRKDGHSWRKKKDGKSVNEGHEKLKIDGVDALHCYYARGEHDENFMRRSYWMLNKPLEHIVLVHYRDLKEGYRSGPSNLLNADSGSQLGSHQTSYASSSSAVDWSGQTTSSLKASLHADEATGFLCRGTSSSYWPDISDAGRAVQGHNFQLVQTQFQTFSGSQGIVTSTSNAKNSAQAYDTFDTENDDKEVSSLLGDTKLDIDSLVIFSVSDFAPAWAYSGEDTKVLIVGRFWGDKWCCMFGDIEVSAEILAANVIRCQVPFHPPGLVPFFITCCNGIPCSEMLEFEYRQKPLEVSMDEVGFQIRLEKMLHLGLERKGFNCSIVECDKCKLKKKMHSVISDNKDHVNHKDALIQNLMKERLYSWLVLKVHEGGKGPHVLDNEGQGVIHLAAALGYEWAMGLIVASSVSPNFRDARGRTALHWASYYGREEAVITLVTLGACPGAVDDPRPASPGGNTAADLAFSRAHTGIASYLAEEDLSNHLSCLILNGNVVPDRATDEECLLKGSLAKSAHAAGLIQTFLRIRSFRHRQLTESSNDNSEVSLDLVALGRLNKVQKMGTFKNYLHSAAKSSRRKKKKMRNFKNYLHSTAIKIQRKYHGWREREKILKIRARIVKIQAHVRGHKVRNQYKKVVWSVSILEKAILRWRRRRPGLRGFRGISEIDEHEFIQIGRKQKSAGVEKALAIVQSRRDQYTRLVNSKLQ